MKFWISARFLKQFAVVLGLSIVCISGAANATLITNLDSVPHTLLIDDHGAQSKVTIPPNGHIRRLSNRMLVEVDGVRGQVDIRDGDEYVIWKGGQLSIQKVGRIRRSVR